MGESLETATKDPRHLLAEAHFLVGLPEPSRKTPLKQEVMNSNYVLFPNKVLSFPKLGIHITNDNLTDEIAKDYLATYPAAKVHFKTIPTDVVKKEVVKEKATENLRELVDRIAEEKGIKKPHWKASDYTLNLFLKENN